MRTSSPPRVSGSTRAVTVRPADAIPTRQGLPAFVGVSDRTAGATGICMNLVGFPSGAAAEPHEQESVALIAKREG